MTYLILNNFSKIVPHFIEPQSHFLEAIALMHAEAEGLAKHLSPAAKIEFLKKLSMLFSKIGLGEGKIAHRAVFIDDFSRLQQKSNHIYDFTKGPKGISLQEKMSVYDNLSTLCFDTLYKDRFSPPEHIIHTSCTGYLSPSAAQKQVVRKGWQKHTTVTHAYHMGCYGAIASLRIAKGLAHEKPCSVDIVHTEISSLHMDPLNHSMSQLVIESLFADGAIGYTLSSQSGVKKEGFKLIKVKERLIANSIDDMTWKVGNEHFFMTLSKDVPHLIALELKNFVEEMTDFDLQEAIFAIHPGGPKIIESVSEILGLKPHQYSHSQAILKTRGNMSSATLPHIWEKIYQDETVKKTTPIISLAFGPGLTIAGALMEKL